MSDFRVGDRVRLIRDFSVDAWPNSDQEGTVVGSSSGFTKVRWDGDWPHNAEGYHMYVGEIVRVEEEIVDEGIKSEPHKEGVWASTWHMGNDTDTPSIISKIFKGELEALRFANREGERVIFVEYSDV